MDALIEKALLDPKYAADLLKRKTPDRAGRMLRTLRTSTYGTAQSMHQVEAQPEQEY
jgi:hypothetical protein